MVEPYRVITLCSVHVSRIAQALTAEGKGLDSHDFTFL